MVSIWEYPMQNESEVEAVAVLAGTEVYAPQLAVGYRQLHELP